MRRKPRVAILATGDELVRPGEHAGPGSDRRVEPYAARGPGRDKPAGRRSISVSPRDSFEALDEQDRCRAGGACGHSVTLGGASVGEHDLVQSALTRQGMSSVSGASRCVPGKPLMHGRLGAHALLGLPGNPVSSIVCAILFLVPAIRAHAGRRRTPAAITTEPASSEADLPANGGRQDYLRATLSLRSAIRQLVRMLPVATAHAEQDSSMLGTLAQVRRAPGASPSRHGSQRPESPADHPARAVLLSVICRAWPWTCGTQREQLSCSRFVSESLHGRSSKGQPC